MISALLSMIGSIASCLGVVLILIVVQVIRIKRRPNEKQIRALQIFLPTDAERPLELHSIDLERLAVYVYQHLGYQNVKHEGTHSSTDAGADVWMLSRQGYVEIVQCKQWRGQRVGRGELIEFARAMRRAHAASGHYWAPNGFSEPAVKYAKQNNIKIYADYEIRKLLERAVEVDDIAARHRQSISIQKKTNKKGWTGAQVAIIFGMLIVLCLLIYYLFAFLASGGS